jgi:uncharacterized protein
MAGSLTTTSTSEPVTVVATRIVKPGHEAAYETWLSDFIQQASSLPGYLGTNIQRPAATGPREYTSVFRFDSLGNLRNFESSELRQQALAAVQPHVETDAVWKQITGFEFWFSPPPGTITPQPSRFRMALVMIAIVYGLVLSIGKLVAVVLHQAPMQLRLLITITIEVFLMTYVLMPYITRWLAPWIYPRTNLRPNSLPQRKTS